MTKEEKYAKLQEILRSAGSAAIAFSGGVDSTFLAKTAADTLKEKAVAFTAVSLSYPKREREESKKLAASIGIRQVFFESEETEIPQFLDNPPDRCYYCKRELYTKLLDLAKQHGLSAVFDGSNADDAGDYRPGIRALDELKIKSPLKEAGLTKQEIRDLSKALGLPTWNKPAFACLSSRFQYGESITRDKLSRVEQAEDFLKNEGFRVLRVRDHGNMVRIETSRDEMERFMEPALREKTVAAFKAIGYAFVSLDLEGYRMGSMNAVLDGKKA
jgi:uncharacterized protein